jgi:hypothetical protein
VKWPANDRLRVLAIRLLLTHSLGADLGRVSYPQLKLQLGHESFEPACMPAGVYPNPHLLARQCAIESFRVLPVP